MKCLLVKKVGFTVCLQAHSNESHYIKIYTGNSLMCILMILNYFKHIEIYVHLWRVPQKNYFTEYSVHSRSFTEKWKEFGYSTVYKE